MAITFVSDESDAKVLNDVQERFEVNISELPDEIDISSYSKLDSRKSFVAYKQKLLVLLIAICSVELELRECHFFKLVDPKEEINFVWSVFLFPIFSPAVAKYYVCVYLPSELFRGLLQKSNRLDGFYTKRLATHNLPQTKTLCENEIKTDNKKKSI